MLKIRLPKPAAPAVALHEKLTVASEAQEAARVAYREAALEAELAEGGKDHAAADKRLADASAALQAAGDRVAALEAAIREAETREAAAEREEAAEEAARRWKRVEQYLKDREAGSRDADAAVAALADAWSRIAVASSGIVKEAPVELDLDGGLLRRTELENFLRAAMMKAGFRWALAAWPWGADKLPKLAEKVAAANDNIRERRAKKAKP